MQLLPLTKMTGDYRQSQSQKILSNLILANSSWKVVYQIGDRYFIEEILAYIFIKHGSYYELIPLTLPDLHLSQSLYDYSLKEGYIGLINPQNELIINSYLEEHQNHINIQKIKEALKKNRFKLD